MADYLTRSEMASTTDNELEDTWTNGRLAVLRPVLEKWIDITRRYFADRHRPQRWNTERTFVGHLASAVHCQGGCALEEYSIRRTGSEGSDPGRADLWFSIEGQSFVSEAKECRVDYVHAPRTPLTRILAGVLAEAGTQAKSIQAPRDAIRVALLFAPRYYFRQSKNRGVEQAVEEYVAALKEMQCDMRAWVLPPEGREFIMPDRDDEWLHLGSAVAGAVVEDHL